MTEALIKLVADVQKRLTRHQSGRIALASDYVSTVRTCMGLHSPEQFLGLGSTKQWETAIKDAGKKLVWREDEPKVTILGKKGNKAKKNDEGKIKTPGACMEFENVLTTQRRDRDRDILEPAGATIDPYMPLLWQHIPMMPIGKLLRVIEQTDEVVKTECAIADSPLGNDSALLVEFGALRISHGFVPTKWEFIEDDGDDKDDEAMRGPSFHVLEYDVLEVSLVSVPSNTDAQITLFSRNKLYHPLVKAWAQAAFETRPTVKSVTISTKGATMPDEKTPVTAPVNVTINIPADLLSKAKKDEEEEETPAEASEHASLGRVQLLLEQISAMEGLPEEAKNLCNQAKAELEHCMAAEAGDEEEEETDDEEEESDEEKFDDAIKEDDEEDDEEDEEEKDGVTPGDEEGRADEDEEDEDEEKSFEDTLFQDYLKEAKQKKKTVSK